jgi:hypothetical protein
MSNHIHENPERTKPIGLARYAKEFHEAAMGADRTLGMKPGYEIFAPIPVLYLIGHSIELSLKAFLLHKGVTLSDLRKNFGHDLGKCFKKAEDLGLLSLVTFDEHELEAFFVLNNLYSTKQLEYIVTGAKTFPIFGYIQSMSHKLLDAISPIVGYMR